MSAAEHRLSASEKVTIFCHFYFGIDVCFLDLLLLSLRVSDWVSNLKLFIYFQKSGLGHISNQFYWLICTVFELPWWICYFSLNGNRDAGFACFSLPLSLPPVYWVCGCVWLIRYSGTRLCPVVLWLTVVYFVLPQRLYRSPNSGLNKARTQLLNKQRMISQVIQKLLIWFVNHGSHRCVVL